MADILFADKKHEELFFSLFKKMKSHDCYHGSAAYLLGLDTVLREHINDVFDFSEDIIKPDGLNKAWQTGTSRKTTRLMFNLWNGKYKDAPAQRDYYDEDEEEPDEEEEENQAAQSSQYYTPDQLFCCSYAAFYVQAIKLRYPEYF
jgi:hypothetical protein